MNKRIIVALSAVSLLITLTAVTVLAGDTPSDWAQSEVTKAIDAGIVPKALQSNYQAPITRAEFADLAISTVSKLTNTKVSALDTTYLGHKFKDTEDNNVEIAYKLCIVNGVSSEIFEPNRTIYRQESAVMLHNIMKSLSAQYDETAVNYSDIAGVSDWALSGVYSCSNAKIMKGTEIGFEAWQNYTREQAILTMTRLLDYVKASDTVTVRGMGVKKVSELKAGVSVLN